MSAMAVKDSITAGESYFIVEIKRLKRILDRMGQGMVYCFIDEILRGTNTIERIAASSAVLRSLLGKQALCLAATHDIELTRILKDSFRMMHFSEQVERAWRPLRLSAEAGAQPHPKRDPAAGAASL